MNLLRFFVLALCMPLISFAATETALPESVAAGEDMEFRVLNPQINSWAQGTVSKLDDGQLIIQGTNMPFATAHAQMRQELQQKLSDVEDAQQRMQIMKKVKDDWRGKLDAALNQKRDEQHALSFKQPVDKEALVILDAKSFRQLPLFERIAEVREQREKMGLHERDFAELYKAREARIAARKDEPLAVKYDQEKRKAAAEKLREKGKERAEIAREKLESQQLPLSDLKPGDNVFVGYDSNNNVAYTIIRNDQTPHKY